MIRALYDWTISIAQKPWAMWGLFFISFAESSFFPIPPDIIMIPMIIAAPRRAFHIASIALAGSVLGAVFGYLIGAYAFDLIGLPVLEFYHLTDQFASFQERYNENGVIIVLTAGVTILPFKLITILSGATGLNFPLFLICAIIARALRFYLVAALLWKFGEPIREFIEKRLTLMATLAVALIILGFVLIKYV